ncbi:LOW QUALITY PROTEIN: hypothetical protein CVT26_000013 [Gymnopilus dilepis]|uniref:CRAL-TRIO domain-containing protein n=1 Tax=Gymnopilus dilepis TaxID=231916 RepID=A0A409VGJ3_9AGAR|nr:LOW QUALITY PROTEIN: hypothetical protein CVT26_000013 [Gymnopilus dilepis]
MTGQSHSDILTTFREQLLAEDLLHDGDSIGTDDETLLRFLRARKFDLEQSKKMFRDCQHWRKTVSGIGIDELYKRLDPFDYPEREVVSESWPMSFHKVIKETSSYSEILMHFVRRIRSAVASTVIDFYADTLQQKGRPINIEAFGGMDLDKLYKSCTPERHWESILVNAECLVREVLPAASRAAGRPIGTGLVIVDLKGFGLGAFWQIKSLVKSSFQVSQDYYPETMGQLAIINAPSTFTIIWNAIKPWLAKETVAKIDILGSDYKDVLLSLVDAENLPASLGGACTCSGLGGCHLSGAGPWQEGRAGWGPKSQAKQEMDAAEKTDGDSEHQGLVNNVERSALEVS